MNRLRRLFFFEEPEPGGTSTPPEPEPEKPDSLAGVNERLDRLENKIEAALTALAKPVETPPAPEPENTPPANPDVEIPPAPEPKKVRRGLRKVVRH